MATEQDQLARLRKAPSESAVVSMAFLTSLMSALSF